MNNKFKLQDPHWWGVASMTMEKIIYTPNSGSSNPWKYIEVLGQQMLLSRHLFSGTTIHISTSPHKTTFCAQYKGTAVERQGICLKDGQFRLREECWKENMQQLQLLTVANSESCVEMTRTKQNLKCFTTSHCSFENIFWNNVKRNLKFSIKLD